MEAASPGAWGCAEVVWGGKTVGRLPYAVDRHRGVTRLGMPRYARVLGPVLTLPPSKPVTWRANACAVVADLVARLPRHDSFRQHLVPDAGTAFAFLLQGWTVEQAYTFQLAAGADVTHAAWEGMDQKTRNLVRTARTRLAVEQHADLDRFVALTRKQFVVQGLRDDHDYPTLRRVAEACLRRGHATILAARDGEKDAASVVLLWDARTLYFWSAARDVEVAGNAAFSFLMWESLTFALGRGLTFDFDGFAKPSSASFLLGFGAEPTVRPVIRRQGALITAYEAAKTVGNWAARQRIARRRGAGAAKSTPERP